MDICYDCKFTRELFYSKKVEDLDRVYLISWHFPSDSVDFRLDNVNAQHPSHPLDLLFSFFSIRSNLTIDERENIFTRSVHCTMHVHRVVSRPIFSTASGHTVSHYFESVWIPAFEGPYDTKRRREKRLLARLKIILFVRPSSWVIMEY